jgi:glutamyl-tRNA reductase
VAGKIFVVGLSWRTAPVAVREKLAFAGDELEAALDELLSSPSVNEALIISTCNRVEIYGTTAQSMPDEVVETATAEARNFIARSRKIPSESLSETLYERTESEAVEHVFRVAAALDSMVVGESQILGQLKDAYGAAVAANASGPLLGRWMERAFSVAKRVRSETGISRGAANVSSVAVELARRVFGELAGKSVLIVGAGKMSALAARHLRANGAGHVTVTNRSIDRARALAEEIEAHARPWEELDRLLTNSDVVISSTGAKEPVLTKKLMKAAMKKRRYKPLVIVDIAVPRDADPSISRLDGVYLFDIDDLERVVSENLKERSREAEAAQRIVVDEVAEFEAWVRSQKVVPTIRSLREHFQTVASTEAEKVIERLRSEHDAREREQSIRRLAQLIANKLLHTPMDALKAGGDPDLLVEVTHRLFDLSPAEQQKADDEQSERSEQDDEPTANDDKKLGSG